MFIPLCPKLGDKLIFWMDETTPAICIVAKVIEQWQKESLSTIRPFLNLCVFRPEDGKPWARLMVPPVDDSGQSVSKAQRYSLPGEYDDLELPG